MHGGIAGSEERRTLAQATVRAQTAVHTLLAIGWRPHDDREAAHGHASAEDAIACWDSQGARGSQLVAEHLEGPKMDNGR